MRCSSSPHPVTSIPKSSCGRSTTNTLPHRRNIRRMSYRNFRKGSECRACTPSLPTGSQGKKERYNPDDVITFLHNDHLIGEYLQNNEFRRYRSYEQYSAGMEKYGKYFVTPSLKARIEALGAPLYDTKAGSPAADLPTPTWKAIEYRCPTSRGKWYW